MCALSEISLSLKFETFLHMIARFLDKPLQVTTLVNFALSPKDVGKPKHSRGITHCQQLNACPHTTFGGTRNGRKVSKGNCGPCIRVIALLTALRKPFYESWWLWNIVDYCCPHH
jgi:hypothetical protein